MHVVAAKALCFKEALDPEFITYIQQVKDNAKIMAQTIMSNGIDIVSNGTENHIILVDLRNKGITGKDLEKTLGSVNITVNKNSVPNDPASPFVTSGIRIGTPAMTTRGFKEKEIIQVSNWISEIINDFDNIDLQKNIKEEVHNLTSNFPVYNF
jgi:glycine hydroxymethyltransferase